MQYVPYHVFGSWMISPAWKSFILAYCGFWQNPMLLLALSAPLLIAILWSANRPVFHPSI
jgi:hypothetical protein